MRISEELQARCMEKNIPLAVLLELTYRCNLSCKHCYRVREKGKELSYREICALLDELREMGTFYLFFTGGEALVRSDFFQIAEYARNKGFLLILMTNGTLISDEEADKIAALKFLWIEISLLGATPTTHDSITKVPGSFVRTIRAIELLKARNLKIVMKTTLMSLNVSEYQAITSLAEQLGITSKVQPWVVPKSDGSLEPLKYQLSLDEMRLYLRNDFEISCLLGVDEDYYGPKICKAGRVLCCISPYGDIFPCLVIPLKLGNIRKNSFDEIWKSSNNELRRIRSVTKSDLKTCSVCDLASFCNRCPGVAYMETGDLLAPSPSACQLAKWRAYLKAGKVGNIQPGKQLD